MNRRSRRSFVAFRFFFSTMLFLGRRHTSASRFKLVPTRGTGDSDGARRAVRGLPLVLPAVAVLAVALAVLVIGRPRTVVGVRVRGGPTVGARALSFRVE